MMPICSWMRRDFFYKLWVKTSHNGQGRASSLWFQSLGFRVSLLDWLLTSMKNVRWFSRVHNFWSSVKYRDGWVYWFVICMKKNVWGWVFSVRQYTVVHERFQHKLNYFLFCQNFEKMFTICGKNLIIIIIIKVWNISTVRFELQTYHF